MANTYTSNFNIPKPARFDLDWDDEFHSLANIVDSELWNNNRGLRQAGADIYSAPFPTDLTLDTNGTAVVTVGASNTGNFQPGDLVGIVDDLYAEITRVVLTKDDIAGTITMTTVVPAIYAISRNARIRRISPRLNQDGLGLRNEAIEDSILVTSLCRASVTEFGGTISISPANSQKSLGQNVALFISSIPGEFITYNGGTVDFYTGLVTGGGDNFTPVNVGGDYITAIISLVQQNDGTGELSVLYGTQDPTEAGALDLNKRAKGAETDMGLVLVLLKGNGSGSYEIIKNKHLYDVRPFLNLGGGGGEGGTASLEILFDRAISRTYFNLATYSIFSIDGASLIDVTTALFNSADRTYDFDVSEYLSTINLIDFDEFMEEQNIDEVEVFIKQLNIIDPDVKVEVTRNGGEHYQEIQLQRVGLKSGVFRGNHVFETESDEVLFDTYPSFVGGFGLSSLIQYIGQGFNADGNFFITKAQFNVSRLGSPVGTFKIKLIKDDGAGLPSTDPYDVVAESEAYLVSSVPLVGTWYDVDINQKLANALYHIVIVPDAAAIASFDGSNYIAINDDNWTPPPASNRSEWDGVSWSLRTDRIVQYEVYGMEESTGIILTQYVTPDNTIELDDSTSQKLAQRFNLADLSNIKQIVLYLNKTEALPNNVKGNLYLNLVEDNSGVPLPNNILVSSGPINLEALSTGNIEVGVKIPDIVKKAYVWFVVTTDQEYKNSYSVGTDFVSIRVDASSPTVDLAWVQTKAGSHENTNAPAGHQYDGGSSGSPWAGQTFTMSDSLSVNKIGGYFTKSSGATGYMRLELWDTSGPGGAPGLKLAETGSIDVSAFVVGSPSGFVLANLLSCITLFKNKQYALVAIDLGFTGSVYWFFNDEGDPYAGGKRWVYAGTWDGSNVNDDYGFRVEGDGLSLCPSVDFALAYRVEGFLLDLRAKITALATMKLEGLAVAYKKIIGTIIPGDSKIQTEYFHGSEDKTEFTLNWTPDIYSLKAYEPVTGQVYTHGANGMQVDGNVAVFPSGTFIENRLYSLRFEEFGPQKYDSSDVNGKLLAENHLGSEDSGIDHSVPGRGVKVRRPDGQLVEISVDNTNNIVITEI